ncbi:MAG: BTAD domain-containing putative transcriptional regulator [Anderseniella sp.]|jgi:predicted ATPase|nr:BTAD domain-containing putative transcriptional regulator [Anderseniella sp.]
MTAKLELSLLGTVATNLNGEELNGQIPAKSQALLCYLAVTGRGHSREKLAGLLWGDKPEVRAQASLRKSLSDLRKLSDSALIITRQTVAFNRDSNYWLDVEAFESAVAEDGAETETLQRLQGAVDLCRGEFLEGFSVRQAAAFEEWVLGERERLRQLLLQTLHRLSVAFADQGQIADAIEYTNRLLAMEPWQEEAHRQLMTLLAHSGQRSAALAQYETCRRMLAEELGVEPLPETQALYHRLKTRRGTALHNLPPQATPFVGRQAELAQIAHDLGRADCRLLTLIGAGGIGKTRLALQAAGQALDAFGDGVFFVSLAGISSSEFLAHTIGEALGHPLSGEADPERQLLNHLEQKEMLLVLDNFEHLLSSRHDRGRDLVLAMVRTAPKLKLLVTSRERLNLQAEWLLILHGLPYPPAEAAFGDETFEAVELFVQGARRVRPEFSLSEEWPEVVRICRLLEGMPLGIELAATWVSMMSCTEIVRELARGLDLLATTLYDVPVRHRSMEAVFDHSWQFLSEPERAGFKKLSIFQGGFGRQAAEQVASASLSTLAALVNKSLLRVVSPGRYDMLEPLKQYAASKLAETPAENESVQNRHCDHYASFLEQIQNDILTEAGQRQAVVKIAADMDNIRSSWGWAASHGNLGALERSHKSLWFYYTARNWFREANEAFEKAAVGITSAYGEIDELTGESRKVLGQVLVRQGWFCWNLGQYRRSKQVLRQGLACLRREATDTRTDVGFALCLLGINEAMTGDHGEAKSLLQEGLAIGKETRDWLVIHSSISGLSHLARVVGAYTEAEKWCHEGIALCRKINNRRGEVFLLNNLAWVANARGDYAEARRWLEKAFAFHEETHDKTLIAESLSQLGTAAYLEGAYAEAKQRYLESIEISKETGERWRRPALIGLGYATCALGEYEASGRHFRATLQLAMEMGAVVVVLDSLAGLATLLAASDRGEAAAEQAVELLAFVLAHPASTQETKDQATACLAELEGRLPLSMLAAAKARGRARDVEDIAREFDAVVM